MSDIINPKRYTYIFGEDIEPLQVQALIDVLHSHDKVDLFFYTDGGLLLVMDALIHYMNQHPDLRIYLTYQVCSCGTDIIHKFNGEIFITQEIDFLLFHGVDRKMYSIRDQGFNTKIINNRTKEKNDEYREFFKALGATKKELKEFDKGNDIYWYTKDLKRITKRFPNVTIL